MNPITSTPIVPNHVNALWLTTGKGPAKRDAAEAAWQEMTPEERERAIRLSKAAG